MRLLRKCPNGHYTIIQDKAICENCGLEFHSAYPPKFSLHDRFWELRRQMKEIARQRGHL
ncbi:MAG: nucleolar RNA-binding Nop10p family protein [Candidatus Thorarchaeota archaeon]